MNKKYDMIIFDIDGTLWDTTKVTCDSLNYVLKKYNEKELVSIQAVKDSMGYNFENCAAIRMPNIKKTLREKYLEESNVIKDRILKDEGGFVYENVKDTIEKLSENYKIAIVSNCNEQAYIDLVEDCADIKEYVLDSMPASKYGISKGEAIKEVIKRNNIASAIYVGDTNLDKEACIEAKIDFIYAKYGFGKNVTSNIEIDSFEELNNIL